MTATIESTTTPAAPTVEPMVPYDVYLDIHKGIRSALFGVTVAAGSIDPADDSARTVLVGRWRAVAHMLDEHAGHENVHIVPAIEVAAPELAAVIHEVHPVLDRRVAGIVALADEVEVVSGPAARAAVHSLYLELTGFTGAYLEHQDFEERRCMRALAAAYPVADLVAMVEAIIASIPPDELAFELGCMLPAMNVDDRVDLLGGMREGAPAEVFAGVCALAESVLTPAAWSATAVRLGIG